MKIVTVLGARPQFIKAATVSRALKEAGTTEVIIHTGQHFDRNMSEVFFSEMDIPRPDYNLEISGLSHGAMTGRMLEETESVLLQEKPDCVLVYGDTNSTLAGALAAAKLHIPIAHVEAGLRSFEMKMPEEVNRILTDRISSYLFCPTHTAVENLRKEGFDNFGCEISQPGDVMYDAVLFYKQKVSEKSTILNYLEIADQPFTLATVHRAENTDDINRLKAICESLNHIHKSSKVILPLHPRTKAILQKNNIQLDFTPIEPVGYFDMLALLDGCDLVLTDSGGLQKEAYFYSKYCITLRDQTEWVELVNAGVNSIVGAHKEKIIDTYEKVKGQKLNSSIELYGDGTAAHQIAQRLSSI